MCLCQTEWLTDDLLKQIQSSDNLCQRLRDPTFMQAIAEFQSSPQAAVQKYGNNPTMQAFFQELWGILGLIRLVLSVSVCV